MNHKSSPLQPAFTKVHDAFYIHDPPSSATKSASADPDIVLFLAWGNAPLKNIVKYTDYYQSIYPAARILLLLTTFADLLLHTPERQAEPLSPVIAAVRDYPSGSRTLIHLCSNGGSYKLREVAAAYKRTTGKVMPFNLLVFDSAPGLPDFWRSITALKTQLPGFAPVYYLGLVCIYLVLTTLFLYSSITGFKPITERVWEDLNDPTLIDTSGNRLYLFSKTDELIDWHDVKLHGGDAKMSGYKIQSQEFIGSKHVAHVVIHKEKYWNVVTESWRATEPPVVPAKSPLR